MQAQKQHMTEENRAQQMRDFVDSTPWAKGQISPLRADASVRRFFRVTAPGQASAVLMDARPPLEDTSIFELMQKKFRAIGLTVPDIYARDHTLGLVLMEDFGDERFFELIREKKQSLDTLYGLATDVLVHKYFADPKIALDQSVAYSDDYWLFRTEQFLLHYMPQVQKRAVTQGERDDFLGVFRAAITAAHKFDPVLLHGDFLVQNLYYMPQRQGVKALGLIDFQDMTDARGNMMGSPAFDLVFLLQDVRMDLPAALEETMRARFLEKTGIKDKDAFNGEYATIGAAQAVKCLGLFARLGHVDGRKEYLEFLPYCWRNINRDLAHPALKDVKNWFVKNKIEGLIP